MRRFRRMGLLLPVSCAFAAGIALGYLLRGPGDPADGGRGRNGGSGRAASPSLARSEGSRASQAGRSQRADRPRAGEAGDPQAGGGPDGAGLFDGLLKRGLFDNPLAGRPRDEILTSLRESLKGKDPGAVKQAALALGQLDPAEVAQFAEMLLAADDPATADMLARLLVRHGGKEGLEAVARMAREDSLGLDVRGRAIEALGDLPPERWGEGVPIAADLLRSGLSGKLQFLSAHVYGRLLGPEAVPGLLGLLEEGSVRPEPLVNAMRDFARPEDVPRLTEVLSRVGGREAQEMLLRAIGSASGADGSRVLLDLLARPPDGVRREAVGWALEEFVRKDDLPSLWETLSGESNREVQAALARSILRGGGAEDLARLGKMAADPASGLSMDSLSKALGDAANRESMPVILDLLKSARTWEASEPLARGLARIAGRDGIEQILALAEQGGNGERRSALIQAVENFGDASVLERLGAMLQNEKDERVSFHLAKAMLRLDPGLGTEALAGRLQDLPDPGQRAAFAQVLGREGGAAFVPALDQALRAEADPRVQWQMARALAGSGPDGIASLGEILAAEADAGKRLGIIGGTESVQPEEAVAFSRRLLRDDPAADVRASAARILGHSGGASAVRDLQDALGSEGDPKVAEAIRAALREQGAR